MPASGSRAARSGAVSVAGCLLLLLLAPLNARAETAGPLLRLLKSGRVPESRLGTVVEMVCKRGDAEDLAYVYQQAVSPDGYQGEVQQVALQSLVEAATNRRVKPAGDLSGLARLINAPQDRVDPATRRAAIELAGLWKQETLVPALQEIARSESVAKATRAAAIEAVTAIGGQSARTFFQQLTAREHPQALRYTAIAALVGMGGAKNAAEQAAMILAEGTAETDPTPVIDAFLNLQGGSAQLAAAIEKHPPETDVAKLALRYMYSIGRSDPQLSAALSKAAGIQQAVEPITKEESLRIAEEVLAHGDPERGEAIFRRSDTSCMKCHAVSKAGGNVGPDLSAVGGSSPVDYLVRSILMPDEAIKEQYASRIVITDDGRVHQGILVDRDDKRMILRDASGKQRTIPLESIDEEEAGKSLMPKGLAKFLTRSELLDLVRFLSLLGKPDGPYPIRQTATMQRWRLLKEPGLVLVQHVPDVETFDQRVLHAPEEAWQPVYGRVRGDLPLGELTGGEDQVLYLYGEVDVTEAGTIGLRLNSPAGVVLWVRDEQLDPAGMMTMELDRGVHRITLRIDTRARMASDLRLELFKPQGSSIEFTVVVGP